MQKIEFCLTLFEEGILEIRNPSVQGNFSLPYFEGVAKLRFALIFIAEVLYKLSERQQMYTHELYLLLEKAKECCLDTLFNSEETGPGIFLVKQLYKQFGKAFIEAFVSSNTAMQWIVPSHLQKSEEV